MNTYECEYNAVETYELTVLRIGFIGLCPCPVEREKQNILYSFTGKDYIKGGEDYVKDRKSESGHYVIPTGKVSEEPPPPLRQR